MQTAARSLALILMLALAAHRVGAEPEPELDSAALVQPALLSGPGYSVSPQAQVHGYMARFTVQTAFGPVTAESVELLAVRAAEMPALEAMERASRSDAFAHAIAERGRKSGNAVVQVISHPIATLTGLPAGVARYFVKKVKSWTNRAQSVSDRGAREFGNAGDPYRAPDGAFTAARQPLPDDPAPAPKDKAWYARLGHESVREAKRQLDYGQMRRELAKHVGVDPYTTNPLIAARLDDLSWAAVAGNLGTKTTLAAVGGAAGEALSNGGTLNDLVWKLDPDDLKEANRQRLAVWCSDDFSVRQFLRRGGFTESLRTSLADGLDALRPTTGCNDLIEVATTTHSELEARYLVNALRLLQRHAPSGGEIHVLGAALAYLTPDRQWYLPLPLDWLSWNPQMQEFFDQSPFRENHKTVLVAGEVTITAQRELGQRGWNLQVRAPYQGAPPYASFVLQSEIAPQPETACSAEAAGLRDVDPYLDRTASATGRCAVLSP
ncbi:MAG: hypothetical protein ABI411_13980 [Tahibacter sp.]